MGKADVVKQILDHIATIDWHTTAPGKEGVSVFETTIRYLGGLLSGKHQTHSREAWRHRLILEQDTTSSKDLWLTKRATSMSRL